MLIFRDHTICLAFYSAWNVLSVPDSLCGPLTAPRPKSWPTHSTRTLWCRSCYKPWEKDRSTEGERDPLGRGISPLGEGKVKLGRDRPTGGERDPLGREISPLGREISPLGEGKVKLGRDRPTGGERDPLGRGISPLGKGKVKLGRERPTGGERDPLGREISPLGEGKVKLGRDRTTEGRTGPLGEGERFTRERLVFKGQVHNGGRRGRARFLQDRQTDTGKHQQLSDSRIPELSMDVHRGNPGSERPETCLEQSSF